jgi:competence protein ComEC
VVESLPVRVLLDGGLPDDGPAHRRIVALARTRGTSVVRAHAGQRFRLGRDLSLRVLHAADRERADEDPNLRATVIVATFRGFDMFLPADAESDVTRALALPPVEVLKVAHHGSADPGLTGLLERLRPRIAVIEVGAHNPFGHPHPSTLAGLRAAGPTVLRTDRDGDVSMSLENGHVSLERGR